MKKYPYKAIFLTGLLTIIAFQKPAYSRTWFHKFTHLFSSQKVDVIKSYKDKAAAAGLDDFDIVAVPRSVYAYNPTTLYRKKQARAERASIARERAVAICGGEKNYISHKVEEYDSSWILNNQITSIALNKGAPMPGAQKKVLFDVNLERGNKYRLGEVQIGSEAQYTSETKKNGIFKRFAITTGQASKLAIYAGLLFYSPPLFAIANLLDGLTPSYLNELANKEYSRNKINSSNISFRKKVKNSQGVKENAQNRNDVIFTQLVCGKQPSLMFQDNRSLVDAAHVASQVQPNKYNSLNISEGNNPLKQNTSGSFFSRGAQ